jgi:RNA-directed DNA polymerase
MSDMTSTKPYVIAKRAVWEAYQQVRANRGAAGIDDETIVMFEQNLSKNLYKLWNRMSSGSYFPPPVKQVKIPKAKGGTRKLGIPTVSDRIAQTVVKRIIEPMLDPIFIRIPMDIGRDGRRSRPLQSPESGAGNMTGWSSLTSKRPSIK